MDMIAKLVLQVVKFFNLGPDTILLGGALMFISLLIFGYMPEVFPGFVTNTQFQVQSGYLRDLRIEQLRRTIDEDRTRQCLAIMEGNTDSMRRSYEDLQRDIDQYLAVAGRSYRIPECIELIATAQAPIPAPTPVPQKVPMAK